MRNILGLRTLRFVGIVVFFCRVNACNAETGLIIYQTTEKAVPCRWGPAVLLRRSRSGRLRRGVPAFLTPNSLNNRCDQMEQLSNISPPPPICYLTVIESQAHGRKKTGTASCTPVTIKVMRDANYSRTYVRIHKN